MWWVCPCLSPCVRLDVWHGSLPACHLTTPAAPVGLQEGLRHLQVGGGGTDTKRIPGTGSAEVLGACVWNGCCVPGKCSCEYMDVTKARHTLCSRLRPTRQPWTYVKACLNHTAACCHDISSRCPVDQGWTDPRASPPRSHALQRLWATPAAAAGGHPAGLQAGAGRVAGHCCLHDGVHAQHLVPMVG